jgi:hypothetical protein
MLHYAVGICCGAIDNPAGKGPFAHQCRDLHRLAARRCEWRKVPALVLGEIGIAEQYLR